MVWIGSDHEAFDPAMHGEDPTRRNRLRKKKSGPIRCLFEFDLSISIAGWKLVFYASIQNTCVSILVWTPALQPRLSCLVEMYEVCAKVRMEAIYLILQSGGGSIIEGIALSRTVACETFPSLLL